MRRRLLAALGLVLLLALGDLALGYGRLPPGHVSNGSTEPRVTPGLALLAGAAVTPEPPSGQSSQSSPTPAPRSQPASAPPASSGGHLSVKARRKSREEVGPRYLVVFVLDGARPDYFDVPGIPHIRALMRSGTRYTNAFTGILESETPSGHAAIGTGSDPRKDGVLSFAWANSDNDTTVNLFNPDLINSGALEHILSSAHAPTIAGLVHTKDPQAQVVALSGHKYYAADAIGGPDANVIMYYRGTPDGHFAPTAISGHVPPPGVLTQPSLTRNTTHLTPGTEDHLTMKLDLATFARLHQRVTLMNVPEFDWPLGHVDGANRDPVLVKTLMQGFDRDLGQLENTYRRYGILNRTDFVITADHGFAPIYHTISATDIQSAVAAAGTSITSDTYHTAAYLWLKDPARAAAAAENVARLQNRYIQSVYFKEVIPGGYNYVRASGPDLFHVPGVEAANQYLLDSFAGPTGPDVVAFFTEDSASDPGGQATWKGDHGGADWEAQHIPLLLSGPGIRKGLVSHYPAQLIDIAPTVLSLLQVPSTMMEGTPLADAMDSPLPSAVAHQRSQATVRLPAVGALEAESRAEVTAGE